jgi:CPA2 family monovalent cation:H+ antiporter-2
MGIFQELVIVLAVAVVLVGILRRLNLPPILGYLLAGTVVGPFGLGLFNDVKDLDFIAEFGVVFLLFAIGLELSFPKLIAMRRSLLGLGGLQVLICTILATGFAKYAGLSLGAALTTAGALTLSSTAVVTKLMIEQDELHQEHGKMALGILLFQDLAAIPFLILIPALGVSADASISIQAKLLSTVLTGGALFIVMLGIGHWLLRPVLHFIAAARSSELLMLTALLVVLGSAFLTEHYGLSMALGAFLAGVMIAETEYVHQIESDILPFRDVLLGLFFITVGMYINLNTLHDDFGWVIAITVSLILTKFLVIWLLGYLTKASPISSIRTGLVLAQGGEFGFALLSLAQVGKVIDTHTNQILVSSIFLSITISPFLIKYNARLASWLGKLFSPNSQFEPLEAIESENLHIKDHVVICGYGRVGQTLARFLEHEGIPFIGLDLDPIRLKEAKAAGEPVYYGDATDLSVLESCHIEEASLLLIAFKDPQRAEKIIKRAKSLRPTLPILVRTEDDKHLERLQDVGATEVIPEKLESSLMLASHMLVLLGIPATKVQQQIFEVKASRYKILQSFYVGTKDMEALEEQTGQSQLHAIELTEGAYAIGRTLAELQQETPCISINNFSRSGYKCETPAMDTIFQVGDIIVLQGSLDKIHVAEEKLLSG